MQPDVKSYKRKFHKDLRHIKVILAAERHRVPIHEWFDLVWKTKEWILHEPDRFFDIDLPPDKILREAIDSIFFDFMEDQRLLANQSRKPFKMPVWSKKK